MEKLTCAFSGHRPEKLPWGNDETDPRCLALKIQMEKELRQLCEKGVEHFICGMARGTDLYFLRCLLNLREEYEFTLEAAIPCPRQDLLWPREEQEAYQFLLSRCDTVTCREKQYSEGCMLRRNRYMVEHADILLTVFDGMGRSGTAATVAYARQRGLEIIPLWR